MVGTHLSVGREHNARLPNIALQGRFHTKHGVLGQNLALRGRSSARHSALCQNLALRVEVLRKTWCFGTKPSPPGGGFAQNGEIGGNSKLGGKSLVGKSWVEKSLVGKVTWEKVWWENARWEKAVLPQTCYLKKYFKGNFLGEYSKNVSENVHFTFL